MTGFRPQHQLWHVRTRPGLGGQWIPGGTMEEHATTRGQTAFVSSGDSGSGGLGHNFNAPQPTKYGLTIDRSCFDTLEHLSLAALISFTAKLQQQRQVHSEQEFFYLLELEPNDYTHYLSPPTNSQTALESHFRPELLQ